MRAVVQRVSEAGVAIEGEVVGTIGSGVMVLLAVSASDGEGEARWFADKVAHLRIWPDAEGKMNRSLLDVGGEALIVSQFTLYGDARKGNRPSYVEAARPEIAEPLYARFCDRLGASRGIFGARMEVELTNDGPVTLLLEV